MGQRFTMRVPTDVDLIEEAVDLVARHCVASGLSPRRARFNLRVALCEALANAIIYGNALDPGQFQLIDTNNTATAVDEASCGDGGSCCSSPSAVGLPQPSEAATASAGTGFDPAALVDPTEPSQLDESGGRGLFLIRKLVDQVSFNDRGNAICMVLRRA